MARKRIKCPPELEGTTFEEYLKFGSDGAVDLALAAADINQEMVDVVMWLDHDCPVACHWICGEDIPKFIRVPVSHNPGTGEAIEWSRDKKKKALPLAVFERIQLLLKEEFIVHPITGKVLKGQHAWDWASGKLVSISKFVHVARAEEANISLEDDIVAFYETYQLYLVKLSAAQRRLLDKGTDISDGEKAELEQLCEKIQKDIESLEPPAALRMKEKAKEAAAGSTKVPVGLNTNPQSD